MDVVAPWVAANGKPGQFLIVIPDPQGERIPLTICDIDPSRESITIVFQEVGDSTRKLGAMSEGDTLFAVAGPLGVPSELLENYDGRTLYVAGGVGTAPIYPQAKAAHARGLKVDVIIGARNRELIFFEEEMRNVCDHLYIMTDDGSYGEKGLVTDKIRQLVEQGEHYDACVAIGPLPMMKFVALLTKQYALRTIVSLNSMMVDGTGMCGACRVTVGDRMRFTCVDGPEFDGHQVDFDGVMRHLARPDARKYRIATNSEGHSCTLTAAVQSVIDESDRRRQQPREQDPQVRQHNFGEVSMGLSDRQAVLEAKRCLHCARPLCMSQCPVSVHIPDFISRVATGDIAGAAEVIAVDSSLPAVCGRVCPQEHQCEGACIMGKKGQAIAIGALERYVADYVREHQTTFATPRATSNGKKVAIVGSGPSGLACAGDLARMGYDVTIFEALHHAGGVLVYGIPEFRLPKQKVVEHEIENLRRMGVEIKTNVLIGKSVTVDDLFDVHHFDAVYIASGAGLPKFMNIPGESLVGVVSANELLTRTNLMHGYEESYATPIVLGKTVLVVGGGNVAMDAARTARRLGSEVTVVYRRGRQEMPARAEEVEHALQEDIHFAFQTNPTAVIGDESGNVKALRCVRMQAGAPDTKGRTTYNAIEGSDFEIEADNVIMALGTTPNPLIVNTTQGLETSPWHGIKAVAETGQTSRPGIFAGGDVVSGAATVILAMGAGRTAARAIDAYVRTKKE